MRLENWILHKHFYQAERRSQWLTMWPIKVLRKKQLPMEVLFTLINKNTFYPIIYKNFGS